MAAEEREGQPNPALLMERIERLSAALERIDDPDARRIGEELSAAVLELHGEGIERMAAALDDAALRELATDGIVGSLLLIHGLYPVPLEERVEEALDKVRPYMKSHGGDVELLGIDEQGVVHLRLEGSCNGCGASSSTLELTVERALRDAAPDLTGMAVEGAVEAEPQVTGTPLPMAAAGVPASNGDAPARLADWMQLDLDGLAPDELRAVEVAGQGLVVADVDGSLLAYRDACASCGAALAGGRLADGLLSCPACDRGFYLPRAGRSLDDERLMLEPVPLLAETGGTAKVALS